MTTKRQRKKIARQLPPVGTTLAGKSKGQVHTAVIVEAKDRPAGRAVTGRPTNGWLVWRAGENGEE